MARGGGGRTRRRRSRRDDVVGSRRRGADDEDPHHHPRQEHPPRPPLLHRHPLRRQVAPGRPLLPGGLHLRVAQEALLRRGPRLPPPPRRRRRRRRPPPPLRLPPPPPPRRLHGRRRRRPPRRRGGTGGAPAGPGHAEGAGHPGVQPHVRHAARLPPGGAAGREVPPAGRGGQERGRRGQGGPAGRLLPRRGRGRRRPRGRRLRGARQGAAGPRQGHRRRPLQGCRYVHQEATVGRRGDHSLAPPAISRLHPYHETNGRPPHWPTFTSTVTNCRQRSSSVSAHPCISKQERKALCRLIDPRKLTQEASLHAVHNDRLPIRSVIQVMFSEQSKLSRITTDCGIGVGSSFSGPRSPFELPAAAGGSSRCPSSRDVVLQQAQQQQQDVVRLREDVARLQAQCRALQAQVDGLILDHKKKKGFFNWSSFLFWNVDSAAADKFADDYGVAPPVGTGGGGGKKAGQFHGGKATPPKWRNSMS
ncbi:putative coleoptile phototropism protein 1-like [Iris pallida]|uniref:Coleoptile phototropism protein 1-like n=1 Tax=Iris pallida TaxID=29817 RepID=A0AAX6DN76_IRIPA|nr:putative coleoptile phototropism protein 1-like [Iris pallida]